MLGIPGVIWRDENGSERGIDLCTRLLKDRIILCTGEVTDELAESVVAQLLYLEAEGKDKPITMIVSGPGGSVVAGFSIISTMDTISCPVYTTVTGQVASMSSVIAASGAKGHRSIMPNARVMLHSVSAGTKGTIQDMEITLEEVRKTNEMVFSHLSKCIGKKPDTLKKDCDRDYWLSDKEAVAYGIMDKIVESRKKK